MSKKISLVTHKKPTNTCDDTLGALKYNHIVSRENLTSYFTQRELLFNMTKDLIIEKYI